MTDNKTQLIQRINDDMRRALKDGEHTKINELRSLVARISNAEAVPITDQSHITATEVPRKELDLNQIQTIIMDEIHELQNALQQVGATTAYATELQEKITILQKYVQ